MRWAAPLSAPAISFGRLGVAAIGLVGLAALRRVDLSLSPAECRKFAFYGLVTALHFLLYVASLEYTTIAHSLAIVYTAPVFTTLLSAWHLREPLTPRSYLGVGVAAAGIGVLAGFEPTMSPRMLVGDALALGSAICFGIYSVAGRRERASYDLAKYAAYVYGMGALWLLPAAALHPGLLPTADSLLSVVALGIFPLAIGHTLYNAGLRRTHATYVNLIATQEVTGGVLLGSLLLAEAPSSQTIAGVGLALLGVITAVIGSTHNRLFTPRPSGGGVGQAV